MKGDGMRRVGSFGVLGDGVHMGKSTTSLCDPPRSLPPVLKVNSGSNLTPSGEGGLYSGGGSIGHLRVWGVGGGIPGWTGQGEGTKKEEANGGRTRLVFWPHAGPGVRRGSLQEYEVWRRSSDSLRPITRDASLESIPSLNTLYNGSESPLQNDTGNKYLQSLEFDNSKQEVPEMTERLFKVIIIGDPTVGKTSFVQRYVQDSFRRDYKGTVGVDFALKILKWSDSETVKLQLWDIAGQERFTWMTRVYYKDAQGCIIMFDLTNRNSFLNTLKWKKDVDSKCTLEDGSPIPCMLLANKCDLPHRQVDQLEIEKLYKDHNFTGWTETSAKEGLMVTDSMRFLVDIMMKQKDHRSDETPEASLRLTPPEPDKSRDCYC